MVFFRPVVSLLFLLSVAMAPARAAPESATAMAPAGTLSYDVMRKGERIGVHTVSFDRMGEELTVRTHTDVDFTVFVIFDINWSHQSVEVWSDGGLKEFTSFTDEDGRKRQVHAQRNGDRLIINSTGGHREFPADLIPGTLWHPDTVTRRELLDPIKGRLRRVTITDKGIEQTQVNGRTVQARHYAMRGDLTRDFWYDQHGTIVKVEFPISDGSEVTLLLR
ncbi:MAG TPA: DUF6134 family protein [Alphaproteobacteria bacterium]|nr:DUF6134 family protein [Alphaproteobacteria bacterium]